jgi:hypothetical protein
LSRRASAMAWAGSKTMKTGVRTFIAAPF